MCVCVLYRSLVHIYSYLKQLYIGNKKIIKVGGHLVADPSVYMQGMKIQF